MDSTRYRILIALFVILPMGLATKFLLPHGLPGMLGRWCLLYGAAVLYEVFWILVVLLLLPRRNPATGDVPGACQSRRIPDPEGRVLRVSVGVFLGTAVLEFAQLWHAPWLDAIRATWLGAAMLGNGFDWWDFPHYAIGSILGGVLAARLASRPLLREDDHSLPG